MSSLSAAARRLTIASGLYRPARWLVRQIRPNQQRELQADVDFYRSLLPPGALCFDVGANVGEKSEALLLAGARVVAFEPNPLIVPELQARCAHDKNWSLVAAGVGCESAVAAFYARAGHVNSGFIDGGEVVATFNAPVVTLDAAIRRFGAPAFCKIDVEGWEVEVLKGLTHPIPLVSFEFQLGDYGIKKTQDCLKELARFGSARVNITPAEKLRFHLPDWMTLNDMLAWFPGDLKKTLPGDYYGDIFVRLDTA
jgi:FkbM family methyltransferase